MGKILSFVVGAGLLLVSCGNEVNIGAGANWPWPWSGNAPFFAAKTFSDEVPVGTQVRIRVEAENGEVAILGLPGAVSMKLTANLRVGSSTLVDAQVGLALLDVGVTDGVDEIFVQTLQPQDTQGRQFLVDYTITIPIDLAVEVRQVNGLVTIEGITSPVAVNQGNGNVRLTDVAGDATAQVANGGIDATLTLLPGGTVRLTTGNGNLDLRIPATTSAALSALVGTGAITWNNLPLVVTVQTNQSLTGTLGGGAGLIQLQTGNGNIDLTGF